MKEEIVKNKKKLRESNKKIKNMQSDFVEVRKESFKLKTELSLIK